jgi:hypothetical protein
MCQGAKLMPQDFLFWLTLFIESKKLGFFSVLPESVEARRDFIRLAKKAGGSFVAWPVGEAIFVLSDLFPGLITGLEAFSVEFALLDKYLRELSVKTLEATRRPASEEMWSPFPLCTNSSKTIRISLPDSDPSVAFSDIM